MKLTTIPDLMPLDEEPAAPVSHNRRWSDGVRPAAGTHPDAPWSMADQWPSLVATLSEQAVESSNLVLRGLEFLVGSGRLRRAEARALNEALHRLRDTSLRAQQITRLAGGRIRQSKDRVALPEVIREQMCERLEAHAQAQFCVRTSLEPADVLMDPAAAVGLVGALLDWAAGFSREVVLSTEPPQGAGPARLVARVTLPAPTPGRGRGRRLNDGLQWMLLRSMAAASELPIRRENVGRQAVVTIEFPKAYVGSDGVASVELLPPVHTDGSAAVGGWVLVLARGLDLREEAVETLERAGLEVQALQDLAQARELMAGQRPAAVVVGYDLNGPDFAQFRHEFLSGEEPCPVVELTEGAASFTTMGFMGFEIPKVGRDKVRKELAPTVLFELAKLV